MQRQDDLSALKDHEIICPGTPKRHQNSWGFQNRGIAEYDVSRAGRRDRWRDSLSSEFRRLPTFDRSDNVQRPPRRPRSRAPKVPNRPGPGSRSIRTADKLLPIPPGEPVRCSGMARSLLAHAGSLHSSKSELGNIWSALPGERRGSRLGRELRIWSALGLPLDRR